MAISERGRDICTRLRALGAQRMSRTNPIQVDVSRAGDTDVVAPTGEIDIATAPAVRQAMQATAGDRRLVLDLRGVAFMDTSGLKLLVEEDHRAGERGGAFAIVPGPAPIQRLLDVAGLTGRLHLAGVPDEEAAAGVPHGRP
jgi:anti-sigma B factor antagonist